MRLESIGKNIRKYRLMRKLRQEDLAEKADLSINYVGAIERGEKTPSLESLISIIPPSPFFPGFVPCGCP